MLATGTLTAQKYIRYTLRLSSYKQFLLPANLVGNKSVIKIWFKFDKSLLVILSVLYSS